MNREETSGADLRRASVGVAIITYRAVSLLPKCLPPLLASPVRPKILVVNSSSNDGTVELAERLGAAVLVIPRHTFNHGATRELARRALGTSVVVMMTPDARPVSPDPIGNLVRPIVNGEASVTYARQVPREGADFFEAFPRHFSYPDESEVRSIDDLRRLGPRTFFCSNVCAAWSNAALDSIGGFSPTLSLEDTIAAVKLLYAGHKIAYCADAVVEHSHTYTLIQEVRRQFDTGYVRAEHRQQLFAGGGDERAGANYTAKMFARLIRERPRAIPYAMTNVACKYLGYRIGYHGRHLPLWLKRQMSAQDFFWQKDEVEARLGAAQPEPRVST
jgi:rhamnosyltransferase